MVEDQGVWRRHTVVPGEPLADHNKGSPGGLRRSTNNRVAFRHHHLLLSLSSLLVFSSSNQWSPKVRRKPEEPNLRLEERGRMKVSHANKGSHANRNLGEPREFISSQPKVDCDKNVKKLNSLLTRFLSFFFEDQISRVSFLPFGSKIRDSLLQPIDHSVNRRLSWRRES